MASGEDFVIDGKPLAELRVVDLKTHLEKRGLSKSGQKNVLVKRLRDHLALERIHDAQAGKDPDAAPNMEMKSCGSNIVAEYLERQQQALQAAKKAAQAVRAASSSSFDNDSDPNPSSRSPRGLNRSADELSPPTHLIKPPEADNGLTTSVELLGQQIATVKEPSSHNDENLYASSSPNGVSVEKPLDLSKEESTVMTSPSVTLETTTPTCPEAKNDDDNPDAVEAKKEEDSMVTMETTAEPPIQMEATTTVVNQTPVETDSPKTDHRKSRSRSRSPASRSGESESRSISRSRSRSRSNSSNKGSRSRSTSVDRTSNKSNEDLADSKISTEDQQQESPAKEHSQQQDNDDDEVEISAPQNAADEIMEAAANVEEITIRRQSKEVAESQPPETAMKKPERKRKWGATTVSKRTTVSISSESLKEIVGPVSTAEATTTALDDPVQLDYDDDEVSVSQPTQAKRIVISREDIDEEDTVEETSALNSIPSKPDDKPQLVLAPTTESLADEYGIIREKSASPSRHTVSRMIHIRGLTRPFTVKILHELLGKFGEFNKDDFWIDTIKSHCFVTYNKEEDASFARVKLHNARWPSSNPFMLHVDFATQDDLDRFKNKPVVKKDANKQIQQQTSAVPPLISRENHVEINNSSKPKEQRVVREIPTNDNGEQRRRHSRKSPSPSRDQDSKLWPKSREWDRGKEWKSGQSPPPPSSRKDESQRRRSPTPPSRHRTATAPSREEVPAKLLDDLFRKTKAVPCIYWLPLTSDQVIERDKERKRRQQERADRLKKLEESEQRFRMDRSRGGRHRR